MKRFFIDIIMLMKLDGKKENYRSLVVSQILLKYSDEDNPLTLKEIMSYLEDYGFIGDGKEKSIKRDIQQLRELYENEDEGYIDEHLEFNYRIDETYKIVMDGNNKVRYKAYYISQRPYELDDLRMLIECINSAKSISSKKAEEYEYENLFTKYNIIRDTLQVDPAFDTDDLTKKPVLLHSVLKTSMIYDDKYLVGGKLSDTISQETTMNGDI